MVKEGDGKEGGTERRHEKANQDNVGERGGRKARQGKQEDGQGRRGEKEDVKTKQGNAK